MPKRQAFTLDRKCYTLAVKNGRSAELTLYGEIVEAQPTDWWGDPIDGQFIILSEFLKDLEEIKGCTELTIHMNSVGGDAYASISIHNRIRELANSGMSVTCIVDGVAMSGGSLIMCAADTVQVNPSSIIMIHNCWTYVWSSADSGALRKLADSLDVINESQAEIYVRKTGKSMDDVRELMAETSYFTGRKAVEHGFADELLEDAEDPDISVSADRHTLYACGRKMRVAAMGHLPEGLKTHMEEVDPERQEQEEDVPVVGGDNITPETTGRKEGGIPMTLEELRQSDPEAAEALLAEAQASVSHDEAVQAERQRCADIDALAGVFDAETINTAKYGEHPCTAAEMAFRAAQEMAKQGKTFMNQMVSDYQESGAASVTSAPASEEEDKPMTSDDRKAAGAAMAAKLRGEKSEEV